MLWNNKGLKKNSLFLDFCCPHAYKYIYSLTDFNCFGRPLTKVNQCFVSAIMLTESTVQSLLSMNEGHFQALNLETLDSNEPIYTMFSGTYLWLGLIFQEGIVREKCNN